MATEYTFTMGLTHDRDDLTLRDIDRMFERALKHSDLWFWVDGELTSSLAEDEE